jgi:predicted dehydrogenase
MEKTKFSIIGFGHIGKRHAAILKGLPEAELTAIADVDPSRQNDPLFPQGVAFFSDADQLFASGKQGDVVCVCTPNGLHEKHALAALQHRCHVIIEKPMALTRTACERIIEKSLQVGRHVFVVKQNRYSPPVKWLKEVVTTGILGNILMVNLVCLWNRDDRYYIPGSWKGTRQLDGGTLFTQFSHFIDVMYWIFGDIKNIRATLKNFTHRHNTQFEDAGTVTFEFENGALGSLQFSTAVWDTNMESSMSVVGTKGAVKIGGQYMNKIEHCHISNYTMPVLEETNPPNDYGPFRGSAANHQYVFRNVINTLRGKEMVATNALEGMKVVDIIERIYQFRNDG